MEPSKVMEPAENKEFLLDYQVDSFWKHPHENTYKSIVSFCSDSAIVDS